MIVLGSLIIAASIAWGIVCFAAAAMTDGAGPSFWSVFWSPVAGIVIGALVIASKWLP